MGVAPSLYPVSYLHAPLTATMLAAMSEHLLQEQVARGSGRSSQISISPRGLIACSQTLDTEVLNLLLNERVSVVCIHGFYPAELCEPFSDWLSGHSDRTVYGHNAIDPDSGKVQLRDYLVDRIGEPRNRLIGKAGDAPEWGEYFRKGEELRKEVEQLTRQQHPIQMLIDMLNQIWAHGAKRERIHGNDSPAGIGRVTRPARDGKSHPMEDPHVDGPWPCAVHLSANVYFSLPRHGGELETFCGPSLSAEEMRGIGFAHRFRETHPVSELLKPEVGDLVIINTRRPHAVVAFSSGRRVSYACFIKHDPGKPLRFYS